jgi:nucleotide-binding universal stress UspA family protein
MFRNILVSFDGSAQAEDALAQAIDLAEAGNARLSILTAIRRPPAWATTPATVQAVEPLALELEREAKQTLDAAVAQVPKSIPVTTILSRKPIREVLLERLKTGDYDLLVMGSRGRGALSAQLLGSVSHFALDHSPIPVLIVHAEISDSPQDRHTAYDQAVWQTPPSPPASSIRPSSSTAQS